MFDKLLNTIQTQIAYNTVQIFDNVLLEIVLKS